MEEIKKNSVLHKFLYSEAKLEVKELITAAQNAFENAYAPHSHFRVGCSLLMNNGTVLIGSNQENDAYPSGLCAERVALFAAGAQYPNLSVKAMALFVDLELTKGTITPPCGACLQVMNQVEQRHDQEMDIYIFNGEQVLKAEGTRQFLPFSFKL